MPYPNEHACRLRDPDEFKEGSFKSDTRKHNGKEYRVIMGRLKGETTMTDQAYRYPKDKWKESEARSHCKDHKGKTFEPAEKSESGIITDFDQPWMITPDAMESIINIQNEKDVDAVLKNMGQRKDTAPTAIIRDNVAVLPITGPIMRYGGGFLSFFFRIASIAQLSLEFQALLEDQDIDAIIFDIHSPGGQVAGINEFSNMVYGARKDKKIAAYVGGYGTSAAYWIASAASQIVIDDTAILGSIGVVVTVPRRNSNYYIEIVNTLSPNKRPDPESDEGRKEILKLANAIAEPFIKTVARNRKVKIETVLEDFGRGGLLVGKEAVKVGMADRLGSLEGLINELHKSEKRSYIMSEKVTREQLEQNFKQIVSNAPDLLSKFRDEARKEGLEDGRNEGTQAERERVMSILKAEADPTETKKAIEEGISSDAAYKQFYEAEKNKRALGLKQLETEATASLGTEEPTDIEKPINESPDAELARRANKLAKEKSISVEEAQKEIMAGDAKLAKTMREYWKNPTR